MNRRYFLLCGLIFAGSLALLLLGYGRTPTPTTHAYQSGNQVFLPAFLNQPNATAANGRRINIPYAADGNVSLPRRTILWFGQVDPTQNYADARIIYDTDAIYIALHIFDRRTWYDTTPTAATLEQWDAVTLSLNLNGNSGAAPTTTSFRFVNQLRWYEPAANYQTAYRGNGSGWSSHNAPFSTIASWVSEGVPNTNTDDRGWVASYRIPFSSLGLAQRPSEGTVWGLGLWLHDRDAATASAIPAQTWPESAQLTTPSTWGQLHFGLPAYTPPSNTAQDSTTIRHGQNGAAVTDAHVGGGFDCGEAYNPNFFNGWGDANYNNDPNKHQFNVQNQANLGDWPCLSKVYITFPLTTIPAHKVIRSATLTLYHFGNSNPAEADDSLIHVLSVGEDWSEASITWNNAPLALENFTITRVSPLATYPGWPGVARTFDVSRAVAQAYANGTPLRLAIYSTDSAMHSGKYFFSSDADLAGRPLLTVQWGE